MSNFVFDTRESPAEIESAARLFRIITDKLPHLLDNMQLPEPERGSRLAIADSLNSYDPCSNQVRNFVLVAVDNIRAVVNYVTQTGDLPMVALYSMIRSAVETSSYGLWFLAAGTKNKKGFFSLRLAYENNEDMRSMGRTFEASLADKPDKVRKRLLELQQLNNDYRNHDLTRSVTTTDVVKQADKQVPDRLLMTGLQVWKACSGVSHGNAAVIRQVLEHVPSGEETANGMKFFLTSRYTFVAGFLQVAVENVEALIDMYRVQSVAPIRRHS
jgi:hypothetical protein